MVLGGKPFDQADQQALSRLIEDRVAEGRDLDFKVELPGSSDSEKREFLADVCSFANSAGGFLIIGVREVGGAAVEAVGLEGIDSDIEVQRLDSLLRTGVQPRIPNTKIRTIPMSSGRHCLVIHVPRSYVRPHMVTLGTNSRFYARNSSGKYPLDVAEIRAAFAESDESSTRLRRFRLDRIADIIGGNTPVPVEAGAKVILHLLPSDMFGPGPRHDLTWIATNPLAAQPIHDSPGEYRFNLDGYVVAGTMSESRYRSYTQVFRSGAVEAVDCYTVRISSLDSTIPHVLFEQELIAATARYVALLKRLGVSEPAYLGLALVGVRGYKMAMSRERIALFGDRTIDRDALILPELTIGSYPNTPVETGRMLRPAFDAVWQGAGWAASPNYNEQGDWARRTGA